MDQFEKKEIQELDSKYRPIGAWGYFGYNLLFSLPLIGFICLLIFCFSDANINRRSYARSFFCAALIGLIVLVIAIVLLIVSGVGPQIIEELKELIQQSQGQQ